MDSASRLWRMCQMMEQIENPMVIDWWWERLEHGGRLSDRTKNNERSAYEDAENMEEIENE